MAVHHAVRTSRQRNSGYRPSRINIMAQGLSTPDPSLSPTHLSIRRGRATTTHYTQNHVSLMVSHNMVYGLFFPLHFHSWERKVHRWNFHSLEHSLPWSEKSKNFRSMELSILRSECPKNFRSMELSFPGTFAPILKKLG